MTAHDAAATAAAWMIAHWEWALMGLMATMIGPVITSTVWAIRRRRP
jgi:hypothetical protein